MTQPEPDLEALKAQIAELQAANDAAIHVLAQQNIGVNVDGIRMMALVEHLLGDWDDPRRLAYELYVQHRFTGAIAEIQEQIQSQVARATLLQGVNGAAVPKMPGPGQLR